MVDKSVTMKKPTLRQAGIAAIVLLVPGGLVLGAALAAHGRQKKQTKRDEGGQADDKSRGK
jgi:hypothetical protein